MKGTGMLLAFAAVLAAACGSGPDRDERLGEQTKKLIVATDDARAQRAGVTNQDIAVPLRTALSGYPVTEYREDKAIPVVLRSEAGGREDVGKLESINVYATSGRNVPLSQVADVVLAFEPSKIRRREAVGARPPSESGVAGNGA